MGSARTRHPADRPEDDGYGRAYLGAGLDRLHSYLEQVRYVLRGEQQDVLLVGKGDGFVPAALATAGVRVTTVDIAAELEPDVVASVLRLPFDADAFETTLCCQVLEHLPFDAFEPALREMRRVTRGHLVLSLPDVRRFCSIRAHVGRRRFEHQISLPALSAPAFPPGRREQMGHEWEIGYAGTLFHDVTERIAAGGWRIEECRRVPDLAWHTFFYLTPTG